MGLRLLLDSADPSVWRQWWPTGLFRGITTNPTLLRRAGQSCTLEGLAELSEQALALGAEELHLQAWGSGVEELEQRGRALAALAPGRILVKLPVTETGVRAARPLREAGIPITFTACYEPAQVLVAAALGARYIAPYLGRIGDLGRDGHAVLGAMQQALDGVGSPTRLLVASLRSPEDLPRLAAVGCDTFTLGPAIAAALLASSATAAAARQFEHDADAPLASVQPQPLP
ncbi:MAG: transaldolase family protein [Synechococcus sp.]|nr:transaldolase family protein [Synechococcus sp.]